MKTILLINDNSAEAKHAAEFVLSLAINLRLNIVLGNTFVKDRKAVEMVLAGFPTQTETDEPFSSDVVVHLKVLLDSKKPIFKPEIFETDLSSMDETKVADLINKNNIWMFIKGIPNEPTGLKNEKKLNVHTVLNKVLCPLMLIPANWQIKDMEHLVYIADLRYCRIQIVKYLAEFAKPINADILIAHLTAKGLPDMAEPYALSVFHEEVSRNVSYENLYFNNIKEKNLKVAVDVIIHGMHKDLLVVVNHRFHFEELLGTYIADNLPVNITVPILIFPF